MTRINVIPVEELLDEHLRAEYREIVRVPKLVAKHGFRFEEIPLEYTIRSETNPSAGKGHVKFFYNKLGYLRRRFFQLEKEMKSRGFATNFEWDEKNDSVNLLSCYADYIPTEKAIILNRQRLQERMPKSPHMNRRKVNGNDFNYWR